MEEEYVTGLQSPLLSANAFAAPAPTEAAPTEERSPYADLAEEAATAPVLSPAEQQATNNRALAQARAGLGDMDDGVLEDFRNLFADRVSHSIKPQYANETENADFRGNPAIWNNGLAAGITGPLPEGVSRETYSKVRTRYFDEKEQAAAKIGTQDGLVVGADGKPLDTTAASGFGTAGREAEGKHLFAMTEDGEMRAADAWGSRHETRGSAPATPDAPAPVELDMVNHSSLLAGERAAAAGELRIEKGKLQQVSDQSGHYHPDSRNLYQALKHFADDKVDMHDVEAKMVGKKKGERPLIASGRELMEYGGSADAESEMRGSRAELSAKLSAAVEAHRRRRGTDMRDGESQAAWKESMDPRAGRGLRVGRPAWEASAVGTDRRGRVQALANLFRHWGE